MRANRQFEERMLSSTSTVRAPGRLGPLLSSLWERVSAALATVAVSRRRSLRLCESLSLGDKRILAIVECDHQRFLVAATPQSISLLQSLDPAHSEDTDTK